jgi:hypothetical protein
MTKDEALDLALEALENSIDLVSNEARNAEELYGKYPTRLARIQGLVALKVAHEKAITAIKQARSAPVQEPVATGDTLFRQFMSEAEKAGVTHWPTPPAAQRRWVEVEQIKWDGDKFIAKLKENT